jgi:uncharacterized protein
VSPPRRLVVFARAPLLGAVKHRLAAGIGPVAAQAFYAGTTRTLLRRVAADGRWRTVLAVTPDRHASAAFWPASVPRIPQGGGDIGARMGRVFRRYARSPVVIVGSDIPAIRAGHVASAFAALGDADAVLGPAEDGGYWLVGLANGYRAHGLFAGVRWSTEHALADTLGNLRGCRVAMLERLADIDDAADFVRWRDAARRQGPRYLS